MRVFVPRLLNLRLFGNPLRILGLESKRSAPGAAGRCLRQVRAVGSGTPKVSDYETRDALLCHPAFLQNHDVGLKLRVSVVRATVGRPLKE